MSEQERNQEAEIRRQEQFSTEIHRAEENRRMEDRERAERSAQEERIRQETRNKEDQQRHEEQQRSDQRGREEDQRRIEQHEREARQRRESQSHANQQPSVDNNNTQVETVAAHDLQEKSREPERIPQSQEIRDLANTQNKYEGLIKSGYYKNGFPQEPESPAMEKYIKNEKAMSEKVQDHINGQAQTQGQNKSVRVGNQKIGHER